MDRTVELRRSFRTNNLVISNDYFIYLLEFDVDVESKDDHISFSHAICRFKILAQWCDRSIDEIHGWKLSLRNCWVLPKIVKVIGCKWIYKTNIDSNGNTDRYKLKFVTKRFTQREGVDYHDTFSLVSKSYY